MLFPYTSFCILCLLSRYFSITVTSNTHIRCLIFRSSAQRAGPELLLQFLARLRPWHGRLQPDAARNHVVHLLPLQVTFLVLEPQPTSLGILCHVPPAILAMPRPLFVEMPVVLLALGMHNLGVHSSVLSVGARIKMVMFSTARTALLVLLVLRSVIQATLALLLLSLVCLRRFGVPRLDAPL